MSSRCLELLSHDEKIQRRRTIKLARTRLDEHDAAIACVVEDADPVALHSTHQRHRNHEFHRPDFVVRAR